MTEAEWQTSNDLGEMVYHLQTGSERKWWLFAVACCHCIRHLLHDTRSQRAIDVIEQIADGHASFDELEAVHRAACEALTDSKPERRMYPVEDIARVIAIPRRDAKGCGHGTSMWVATVVADRARKAAASHNRRRQKAIWLDAHHDESTKQCHLLRDIFGNPFRPIAIDSTWLTPTVVNLAQAMYDERAFDRLPILADALEEAGCQNAGILGHCRGPGPHVRGCWVVDLVLGKE